MSPGEIIVLDIIRAALLVLRTQKKRKIVVE